jgi:hypothetical protein
MTGRSRRGLRVFLGLSGVALALGVALAAQTTRAPASACVGAAARDRGHKCSDRTRTVVPSIADRDLRSDPPCDQVKVRQENIRACVFGVPAAGARANIALVGDSHALHWRPALKVVAFAKRWHGISITTSSCFFSAAVKDFLPGARETCTAWYSDAQAWFREHPEVSTVFVSQKADTPVAVRHGRSYFAIKSAGFRRAWTSLPKTVKHVVVIRDVPTSTNHTLDCVRDAIAAGKRAGPTCPLPRSTALKWDTAVSTVHQLHAPRYQSVDLTEFFCDSRNCYLVVGGVLVNSDLDHITGEYSRTLGPYLLRKVSRLMRSW